MIRARYSPPLSRLSAQCSQPSYTPRPTFFSSSLHIPTGLGYDATFVDTPSLSVKILPHRGDAEHSVRVHDSPFASRHVAASSLRPDGAPSSDPPFPRANRRARSDSPGVDVSADANVGDETTELLSDVEYDNRKNPSIESRREGIASSVQDEREGELECVGTGYRVECFVPDSDSDSDLESDVKSRAISSAKNGYTNSTTYSNDTSSTRELSASDAVRPDSSSFSPLSPSKVAPFEIDLDGSIKVQKKRSSNGSLASQSELKSLLESEESYDATTNANAITLDNIVDWLVLISPFFFWGTAMVAMKELLPKAGPQFVASVRLIPAGALLIVFAALRGRPFPRSFLSILSILIFAAIDGSCFQGFLAEGLEKTSAGLGSVIIDSQPLTVAILASIIYGELISRLGVFGLFLGIVGLVLLEVPKELIESIFQSGASSPSSLMDDIYSFSLWDSGEWWMFLAAQSMAVGTILVRWVCKYNDPIMATGWHMVVGGIPLLFLSALQHEPAFREDLASVLTPSDYMALFYTSVFGSAISYGVFFYNANKGNLTRLSSLTFLTPMFASIFGYFYLGETFSPIQLFGASITIVGIYFVNVKTTKE